MPTKKPAESSTEPERAAGSRQAAERSVQDAVAGQTAARGAMSSVADTATDSLVLGQQQALETMEAAGQAVIEGVTRFRRELADFVSERIRHDMETQKAMLRCRSLDEFREVQAEFLRTAVDQYSAEASKLMQLGTEMMQRSLDRSS